MDERIRDKSLRSEGGAEEVATGQARSADEELAHHARRRGLHGLIHHVAGSVGDGQANGHSGRSLGHVCDLVPGGEGGGLCGAVDVKQTLRRPGIQHSPHPMRSHGLSAEKERIQGGEGVGALGGDEVEEGGGEEEGGDALTGQEIGQSIRIQEDVFGDKDDDPAVEQRSPHLEGGGVECRVGGLGHPLARLNLQIVGVFHQSHHGPMRNDHPFGATGGAGGIDQISGVFGMDARCGGRRRLGKHFLICDA